MWIYRSTIIQSIARSPNQTTRVPTPHVEFTIYLSLLMHLSTSISKRSPPGLHRPEYINPLQFPLSGFQKTTTITKQDSSTRQHNQIKSHKPFFYPTINQSPNQSINALQTLTTRTNMQSLITLLLLLLATSLPCLLAAPIPVTASSGTDTAATSRPHTFIPSTGPGPAQPPPSAAADNNDKKDRVLEDRQSVDEWFGNGEMGSRYVYFVTHLLISILPFFSLCSSVGKFERCDG